MGKYIYKEGYIMKYKSFIIGPYKDHIKDNYAPAGDVIGSINIRGSLYITKFNIHDSNPVAVVYLTNNGDTVVHWQDNLVSVIEDAESIVSEAINQLKDIYSKHSTLIT